MSRVEKLRMLMRSRLLEQRIHGNEFYPMHVGTIGGQDIFQYFSVGKQCQCNLMPPQLNRQVEVDIIVLASC